MPQIPIGFARFLNRAQPRTALPSWKPRTCCDAQSPSSDGNQGGRLSEQSQNAPDGIAYEVRWVDAGKHRQRTFTVKREAERFALKVENTVAEGDTTAPLVKRTTTVAQIVERVMAADQHRLKPRSLHSSDLTYQARVLPKFGARRISTITHSELQTWVDELSSSGLAASTVRHAFQAMSKVCKRAIIDREIKHTPAYGVTMPRARPLAPFSSAALDLKQLQALAAKLEDEPPYGVLVRFLALTGLRAGEASGLRGCGFEMLIWALGTLRFGRQCSGSRECGSWELRSLRGRCVTFHCWMTR